MTGLALVLTILFGLLKILISCLPSDSVKWIIGKYEMHAKLNAENTVVTYEGKRIEDEEANQIIDTFNKGIFLEQYYIFPGNEQMFLHPENGGTPLVIDTKQGKKDVKLFLYSYSDHVDVVKQYKKKVMSYSLRSAQLQDRSIALAAEIL
ncbi:YfmQ family protein [Peribacillus sp. B-H-3]|uniref:YfmQ family protein n=1 Tax=Peribacillus sp. B-H-3 TaxID=3400420 RepID=UPI003B01C1E4